MEYVLALDQGTTSTRALLFDRNGSLKGVAQKPIRQFYPQPGWVHHDPTEIIDSSIAVLKEVVERADVSVSRIAALGITNQRETTVFWERKSGKPVHNAIVWQSRQSAGICQQLLKDGYEASIRAKTGLVLDAYFSASKIRWLFEEDPALRARAARKEILIGTVDSWLIWNLSQERRHVTDFSNASRTMLLDINSGEWDAELLNLFITPREALPDLVDSSGQMATLDEAILGAPIPIAGIAGDQQAALFGQRCFLPGEAKNTYGTGCFFLTQTGHERMTAAAGILSTIAWRLNGKLSYALEGSVFAAGAAIQWLRDGLGIIDDAAASEGLARSLPSNEGVYMVPAFVGLGAPYWDPMARGTIVGLTRGSGRAHFARAALESIAYQSADLVRAMGIPITRLRVDGGATANRFLMQFQADILGVPVEAPVMRETTSLGAAYLAGLGVGLWRDPQELRLMRAEEDTYQPSMADEERRCYLKGWKAAVSAALSVSTESP